MDPPDLVLLLVGEAGGNAPQTRRERPEGNTKQPVVAFLILCLICLSETSRAASSISLDFEYLVWPVEA